MSTPSLRRDGNVAAFPPAPLAALAQTGILAAADVHVAERLCALAGEDDPAVMLAVACAVRAPRLGHVCVDLSTIGDTLAAQASAHDLPASSVPPLDDWRRRLSRSPLVRVDDVTDVEERRPLQLDGRLLYLDRYWRDEHNLARVLMRMGTQDLNTANVKQLRKDLSVIFPDGSPEQLIAVACGVLGHLTVIGGGPGTGKTTTITRLVALIDSHDDDLEPRHVALAAPTGKAAQRMKEAIESATDEMPVSPEVRERLRRLEAVTVHRLLRPQWGSQTRFHHHSENRLPHRLVIVDEASMMPLSLMTRLCEALRDDARLVLVGDPDQLASVEAGAVLGDIIGPARDTPSRSKAMETALSAVLDTSSVASASPARGIGDGIVILRRVHRFGGGIADLADAVRAGDAVAALGVLADGRPDVEWIDVDAGEASHADLATIREVAYETGDALIKHARAGSVAEALSVLENFRLLCPHRRGPYGAEHWGNTIEEWLGNAGARSGVWYPGRPIIVTRNDRALRLFNGDTGVIVQHDDGRVAVFARGDDHVAVAPRRLMAAEPVHAMTIHKSQGSQFRHVAVIAGPADSPLSTRELLYTAVTRARAKVTVLGTADNITAAVTRPITRASGLRARIWET